ncbi:MAG: DUF932 domain-containing protein [Armatimonadota bacterium]
MAHELLIRDGKAAMMYVDEVPWHGLGTRLLAPPTAEEAITAAGLNWTVQKKQLFAIEGATAMPVEGKFAIVPSDQWGKPDCPIFGVVSDGYEPLQNNAAFAFFDPIIEMGAATYETAGALFDGKRVWVLAKMAGLIRVGRNDVVDQYLLLSNSHDASSAVQIKFTPIRVVCNNTLTMALQTSPMQRVFHDRNLGRRMMEAQEMLTEIVRYYQELGETFQALAEIEMNQERLAEYLTAIFPDPKDPEDERAMKYVNMNRAAAERLFQHGKGNDEPDVRGTLWAAYNGITEFIDHRDKIPFVRTEHGRLDYMWFGEGYRIKARAFELAKSKLGVWPSRRRPNTQPALFST